LTGGFRSFIPIYNNTPDNIFIECEYVNAAGVMYGNPIGDFSGMVTENALMVLDVSPAALNTFFTGDDQIDNNCAYYLVKLQIDGEFYIYRFDIYSECKYRPYCLHFMNQFGGFESYDFTKLSRKKSSVEKKKYQQQPYIINQDGQYQRKNAMGVLYGHTVVFASNFTENLTISTDLLTDAEYRWLKELVYSPMIYLEDTSGIMVPVSITLMDDYEEKKFINDSCSALQLEVNFNENLNTQSR
jgi:hypothetical protein